MLENQPHWNTATVMPSAAPSDSRLVSTPIAGTMIERNRTIRARKPRPTTTSRNHGSASVSTLVKSAVMAWKPPTYALAPVLSVACGMTSWRRW